MKPHRRPLTILALASTTFLLTTAESCQLKATLAFASSTYSVGNGPGAMAVGDFNGDGYDDLLVASSGPTLSVQPGDGNGSFSASITTTLNDASVHIEPNAVAAADLNGDGRVDVVFTGVAPSADVANIVVALSQDDSSFKESSAYAFDAPATVPTGVTIADFNGDGHPDLAVTHTTPDFTSGSVDILFGAGDGTFPTSTSIPVGAYPYAIAAGDFNGDGRKDLAITDNASNNLTILTSNGDGTFQVSQISAAAPTTAIAIADLNHDGLADIAVATTGSATALTVLLNKGNGAFADPQRYRVDTVPSAIAIADYDGDGQLDVAIANRSSSAVLVFLGNSDGTLQDPTSFSASTDGLSLATADFNLDGEPDLALSSLTSGDVSVMLNTRFTDGSTDDTTALLGKGANNRF
jgi:hypothetical protein